MENGAAWQKMESGKIRVFPITEKNCSGLEQEGMEGILEDTQRPYRSAGEPGRQDVPFG